MFLFFSCRHEQISLQGNAHNYATGVFVVNQGTFSLPGSITWHNPETGETVADIYGSANGGALLGQFVQSLAFLDDKAYIVVNGANKIVVANATTFSFIDTIGGLALPRYLIRAGNGFAYVSQWGADGLTGSLAKVDLATRKVVGTIPTGNGPEQMILRDDHTLLVANSGGYGVDSTVSVIDLTTGTETARLPVHAKNPCCVSQTHFGTPYYLVLCSGSYLDAVPGGRLVSLDNGTGYDLPPYGSGMASTSTSVYACAGGSIYQLDASGFHLFVVQPAYCINVSDKTGDLFCGDAKDFSTTGTVAIYHSNGQPVSTFQAGIAPGQILLRE
jgi:DNA-binding beta-propeller fold protein YncE